MTLLLDPTEPLRALTCQQPYPFLIERGIKTVETRGRRCNYRGLVGIAAAATVTGLRMGQRRRVGDYSIERDPAGVLIRGPIAWPYWAPLGAIVAVANLYDCVPIVHGGEEGAIRTVDVDDNGSLWLVEPQTDEQYADGETPEWREITHERPYGDYRPGRWALLLEDVRRLPEPVACRGQQAVPWRVPDDVAARVREQIGAAA